MKKATAESILTAIPTDLIRREHLVSTIPLDAIDNLNCAILHRVREDDYHRISSLIASDAEKAHRSGIILRTPADLELQELRRDAMALASADMDSTAAYGDEYVNTLVRQDRVRFELAILCVLPSNSKALSYLFGTKDSSGAISAQTILSDITDLYHTGECLQAAYGKAIIAKDHKDLILNMKMALLPLRSDGLLFKAVPLNINRTALSDTTSPFHLLLTGCQDPLYKSKTAKDGSCNVAAGIVYKRRKAFAKLLVRFLGATIYTWDGVSAINSIPEYKAPVAEKAASAEQSIPSIDTGNVAMESGAEAQERAEA